MFSNLTCAFSGAFIISGGLSIVMWSKYNSMCLRSSTLKLNSFHPRSLDASPDLLGCIARQEVLLLVSRPWLGRRRSFFHDHNHYHWSVVQVRRRMPCELCPLNGGFLGSLSCDCWSSDTRPIGYVSESAVQPKLH